VSLTRVLLPELVESGELVDVTGAVEELLMCFREWDVADDGPAPASFVDGTALQALRRLWSVLAAAQRTAASRGRLFAPDSRYVHAGLHLVLVEAADVDALAAVGRALGELGRPESVDDALDVATGFGPLGHGKQDVVRRVAQLAGLLDLVWTEDAALLAPRVALLDAGTDVVLSAAEEAA